MTTVAFPLYSSHTGTHSCHFLARNLSKFARDISIFTMFSCCGFIHPCSPSLLARLDFVNDRPFAGHRVCPVPVAAWWFYMILQNKFHNVNVLSKSYWYCWTSATPSPVLLTPFNPGESPLSSVYIYIYPWTSIDHKYNITSTDHRYIMIYNVLTYRHIVPLTIDNPITYR